MMHYQDMVSKRTGANPATNPASLPDPAKARRERDRAIALAFVLDGGTRHSRAKVAGDLNLDIKQVQRAVNRELEWAKEEASAIHAVGAIADAEEHKPPPPKSREPKQLGLSLDDPKERSA